MIQGIANHAPMFEVDRIDYYRKVGDEYVLIEGPVDTTPVDTREMTVYDCLACKNSWRQQVREPVASCVYCGSVNTKSIATVSSVREYPLEVR